MINSVWQKLHIIKNNIKNFDLRPAKPVIEQKLSLVDEAMANGSWQDAENRLRKLLHSHPNNMTVVTRLIDIYCILEKRQELKNLLEYAIKKDPSNLDFYNLLAAIYFKNRSFKKLAQLYAQGLSRYPDLGYMQHFYKAVTRENSPKAPQDYVKGLFDSYAESFENSMQDLEYCSPMYLARAIKECNISPVQNVLDLGCGTGLLGQELKQYIEIKDLIGVDISESMLEMCASKNVYQNLITGDLLQYLDQANTEFDLIVSSDCFVYLGDLSTIFSNSRRILKPGGYLAFTVEKLSFGSFKLSLTGRYKHSLKYLKSLYKKYHFSKIYSQTIDLRKECGNMVAGYLVLIQK